MKKLASIALTPKYFIAALLCGLLVVVAAPASAAPTNPFGTGSTNNSNTTSTTVPKESASVPGSDTILPDDLAAKQASADAVAKELDRLGVEQEIAAEAYNKSKTELEETEIKLNDIRLKLREATEVFHKRQEVYTDRLNSIYRSGGTEISFLQVLLQTTNFSDFLSRLNYLMQINSADSSFVSLLSADKQSVDEQARLLEIVKQQQLEGEERLREQQEKINENIRAREEILSGLEADIRQILQEDELKKSAAQKAFVESLKARAANSPDSQLKSLLNPSSVVATALQYLGIKYVWGGETPRIGLDCSGLVLVVFRQHGVFVPHYSGWQFKMGTPVPKAQLQPGDLVFYGHPVHHVGIYIGDGYYIHAPRTGDVVKISSIERPDWAGARRFPLRNKE